MGATIRNEFPEWTARQIAAHEACDIIRAAGVDENHPAIQGLQTLWWEDYTAVETPAWELVGMPYEHFCTMCMTVFKEAGELSDIETDENVAVHLEFMRAVACVLYNRVNDPRFPDNVIDCVVQKNQYNPSYVVDNLNGIPQDAIDAVTDVLTGVFTLPTDCVGQSQSIQKGEVYKSYRIDTGYYSSTSYIWRW